jgi:hypothetical protein
MRPPKTGPKTNGGAKTNEAPKTGMISDRLIGQDVKDVQSALKDLHFTNVKLVAATSENPGTRPGEVVSISPKGRPYRWTGRSS